MESSALAKYVIHHFDSMGDPITPKKLQKLLYYIEAWNLVYFETPLIDEEFEAWVHGPVIPAVYREYRDFGYEQILLDYDGKSLASKKKIEILEKNPLLKKRRELVDTVLLKYGALSSFQLEILTHNETPWIDARGNLLPFDSSSAKVSKITMKSFYTSLLNE